MTADTTTATGGLRLLASVVDALVAQPLGELSPAALQEQIVVVAPQAARLEGWVQAAAGRLDALTGGQLPTEGRRHPFGRGLAGRGAALHVVSCRSSPAHRGGAADPVAAGGGRGAGPSADAGAGCGAGPPGRQDR